jgi:hypothetical protein
MRLYCKLALLLIVGYVAQALMSNGVAGETYFALRCLVAAVAHDERLERQLIHECEEKFVAERHRAVAATAYQTVASR